MNAVPAVPGIRCDVCGTSCAPLAIARTFDGYVCADRGACAKRGERDAARTVALQRESERTHARLWLRRQIGGGWAP